jgi:hypothetical protein
LGHLVGVVGVGRTMEIEIVDFAHKHLIVEREKKKWLG